GIDRRGEPRHKIVERLEVEYFNHEHQTVGREVVLTESLSASGCRIRVSSAPPEFDWLKIKSLKRQCETIAFARNQYRGPDGVERFCGEFVENPCPDLPQD